MRSVRSSMSSGHWQASSLKTCRFVFWSTAPAVSSRSNSELASRRRREARNNIHRRRSVHRREINVGDGGRLSHHKSNKPPLQKHLSNSGVHFGLSHCRWSRFQENRMGLTEFPVEAEEGVEVFARSAQGEVTKFAAGQQHR